MKIVLIGAGNVAYHLGPLLQKKRHRIIQIYSPTKKNGIPLADELKCDPVNSIKLLNKKADLYILAVKDEAIATVLEDFTFVPKLIVHTSGSIGINVFPKRFTNCGVLYPLQTFTKKNKSTPDPIPFCIEGNNKTSLTTIRKVAKSMSPLVYEINSENRRVIHLGAVFANNFTNYLFALSSRILEKKKIKFDILKPLIQETVNNISKAKPSEVQSGPARRNDKSVIQKHLQMLKDDKEIKKVYKILSSSITKHYSKN